MGENRKKSAFCDNAIIHYYPLSPFIAKCSVNLRMGEKIVLRVALRDEDAAKAFLRGFCVPAKTIVHM
jgi:hypothetical protein